MNILILDRNLGGDGLHQHLIQYEKPLRQKGHIVKTAKNLHELVKAGDALERYDLAIIHPAYDDSIKLMNEVQKRSTFRVILHTMDSKDYPEIFLRESGQVCTYFTLFPEKLVKFIEEEYK